MTQLIVDTQGARLRKSGGRLEVEADGRTVQSVPMGNLHQVILMGQGVSASTPLLYYLVNAGIDVVYQSQGGRFAFRLVGPVARHSALRVQQVRVSLDGARALALARPVVAGKLRNQATLLTRYGEASGLRGPWAVQVLREQAVRAEVAANAEALRGIEGSGAAAYFAVWPALFDARAWRFKGRVYHPATDPLNALLSFGYALLLNDIVGAVYRIGLDPAIGVLHTVDYGRPSLALDLEEEFRPVIVDSLVLAIVRQRLLQPEDFTAGGEGAAFNESAPAVRMTSDARRFVIARYQERLGVRVRHPQWDEHLTYRQCIERQVEHMARCLAGREGAYQPLLIE